MRPRLRFALGGALALLLLLGLASVALAHAELLGSDPADGAALERAPERVQLFFSEPIEPEFFALQVFAADRQRVDRGDARIAPTDARVLETGLREVGPGRYTVVWRAVSLDGHVVRGSFTFAVGAGASPGPPLALDLPAEGAPFALEAAARWLTFLGTFLLLGGFAFLPLVLGPVLRDLAPAGAGLEAALQRRWLWLAWAALALLLAVSFVALLFQAASAAGLPLGEVLGSRAVSRLLVGTRYGALWVVRVLLLLGLAGVLAWLAVGPGAGGRWRWWVGAALSAAVLLTISASGHASAQPGSTVLAVLADWAHLLAGGLWVGGLVQLGLALPAALARADPDARRRLLATLVPRFSWLAGSSVAVLALTGAVAALTYVPSPTALLDTPYGAALSGKLLIVAPLLALGAINLLALRPRLRRAGRPAAKTGDDPGARRLFRALVLGEVALAAGVLAATAVLTGLPPASSLPLEGRPFAAEQHTASYAVTLEVRPNQAGDNLLAVELLDHQGQPVTSAGPVRLTLEMLDMEMGAREVELPAVGPGRFEVRGGYLTMPGHWQAEVTIAGRGSAEGARFAFVVGQAPGANRPAFSPGRVVLLALGPQTLFALVALAGAALLVRGAGRRRPRRRMALTLAALLLATGLGTGGASLASAYWRSLPNPVPADAASLARGEQVYQANCAGCHGLGGRGDGPAGIGLRPPPADFRVHLAAGHTDRELFEWVTNGVAGTAMPAWGDRLSEQERWDVINYVRALAAQP